MLFFILTYDHFLPLKYCKFVIHFFTCISQLYYVRISRKLLFIYFTTRKGGKLQQQAVKGRVTHCGNNRTAADVVPLITSTIFLFSITTWWLELTKKVTPSCMTTPRNCLSLLSPTPNYSKLVLRIKLGYTCFFKVSILLTEWLEQTWPNLRPISSVCWHWDIVNSSDFCVHGFS